jgi:hypothetical protein
VATAFLVGLLLGSIITYAGSLAFARTAQPLVPGNVAFLGALVLAAAGMPGRTRPGHLAVPVMRSPGSRMWDLVCLVLFLAFGGWLMATTLSFPNGDFRFGFKSWSDFGANLALSQSLLLGHNFPTEHPFFPGEPIRYHFLFWFQGANLAFLGLPLVAAINLLSVLSLMALLVQIMAFAESLFDSRAVGRIAAALFFLASSSLSYLPFLWAQASPAAAWNAVLASTQFLASGYPYRGEDWGALTVGVFANQRHLISGTGLLLVVLVALVDLYKHYLQREPQRPASDRGETAPPGNRFEGDVGAASGEASQTVRTLIFSGALVGLLPYWNSAVFVSALILLGSLWLLFPYRRAMACVLGAALLVGLPQVLMLRSGNLVQTGQSLFHWGYVIPEPTVGLVLQYLAWTFGFKWLLIAIALWSLPGAHRRLFLALSSLLVVVFLARLSTDVFNNHKLLNLWNVFATAYVAYALWHVGKGGVLRTGLGVALALAMTMGAIIDLFPIRNDTVITVPHENDRLTKWVLASTKPTDVFLTHPVLAHPIVFAGRRTFLGYTLFAWTAGYAVGEREKVYRSIFRERDRSELMRLLHDHGIAYVGIDNDLRGSMLKDGSFDESRFQREFEKVFDDTERRYGDLTVYKVPDRGSPATPASSAAPPPMTTKR